MPRLRKASEELANLKFVGQIDAGKRETGLKDKHIAESMGVTRQTIVKWKKDPEKIPAGQLRRLVKGLHISPEAVIEFIC